MSDPNMTPEEVAKFDQATAVMGEHHPQDAENYVPIPVEVARQIGQQFKRQVVVIVAWEQAGGMLHVTTWGELATHKAWAARLGSILADSAGSDIAKMTSYEDFREPTASATNAVRCEQLTAICKTAGHALRSYQCGNSAPDLAQSIADEIDAALLRMGGKDQ